MCTNIWGTNIHRIYRWVEGNGIIFSWEMFQPVESVHNSGGDDRRNIYLVELLEYIPLRIDIDARTILRYKNLGWPSYYDDPCEWYVGCEETRWLVAGIPCACVCGWWLGFVLVLFVCAQYWSRVGNTSYIQQQRLIYIFISNTRILIP